MEIIFPVEFMVVGTPVSLQARGRKKLSAWKERVATACEAALPSPFFASAARVEVVLFYFPDAKMDGDLDNIIKPILDALIGKAIIDDQQVDRLVVQRFAPGTELNLPEKTELVVQAMANEVSALYIRLNVLDQEAADDAA